MSTQRDSSLLPRFSVRRPVTVLMIFTALLVVGYIAYTKIPMEMMPTGYQPPFMGVFVPYPNATPEEIESQITRPVEEMLGTVRNVKNLRANISRDNTWIRIEFQQGTDMELAYAEVRDRMDRVKADLPDDVERIYVRRFDMNDDADMWIALRINKEIPDLQYFLDHNIGKKLQRVDGIANVQYDGVEEKSFEVELQMDKISAHRINVFQMVNDLRNSNFAIPSGYVTEGDRRFYIRAMGRFQSIDEIKKVEVRPGVLLEDVATVKFDVPDRSNLSRIDGVRGVWIRVDKESGANSVVVHQEVMKTLDEIFADNPALAGIERGYVFSQGQMIMDSLADLQETALWAGLFAVIVLYFFLRHLRMTFVITLAIPISLLVTLVVMYFTGETLNLISLMGLMVSVGLVVDNSVVVLENIFRLRKHGVEPKTAAIKGASEVGLAIVMSTLTSVVVFLPMILMGAGSMMGFMMQRLGMPIIFSLLSSLFVALVFIPLTTTVFKDRGSIGNSILIQWARDRYVSILRVAVNRRVESALISVLVLFTIFAFTSDMGYQDEMQDAIDTNIRLRFAKKYSDIEGVPLKVAEKMEAWCNKNQELLDFDAMSTNINDTWVRISLFRTVRKNSTPVLEKPLLWAQNALMLNDMQKDPEVERRKQINERLLEEIGLTAGEAELFVGWGGNGSGGGAIQLVLEGNDYVELRNWGERVRTELKKLPGIVDVETDIESGNDELSVSINRERARAANVDMQVAVSTIASAVRGVQLPKFQERDREIDILVRLREEDRKSVEDFRNLRVPTLDGREVTLASIASFVNNRGPASISHYNRKPNFGLTVTAESDRLDQTMPLVAGAMRNLGNGEGYTYSFGERSFRIQEDQGNFVFSAILAVVFVFLLMGVLFESFALPLTIITCIPFAFAGSQLLLKIYSMPANLFAYIGIIIIVGVVVNNGIVLVDLINRLRKEGVDRFEAIMQAGFNRFRPILMTAGTTIVSLIPMAFGDSNLVGMPYNPLGMAMMGGLALNSILTLVMVPVFYTYFDDLKRVWQWSLQQLFGRKAAARAAGATASAAK